MTAKQTGIVETHNSFVLQRLNRKINPSSTINIDLFRCPLSTRFHIIPCGVLMSQLCIEPCVHSPGFLDLYIQFCRYFGLAWDPRLAQTATVPLEPIMRFDIICGCRSNVLEALHFVMARLGNGPNRAPGHTNSADPLREK